MCLSGLWRKLRSRNGSASRCQANAATVGAGAVVQLQTRPSVDNPEPETTATEPQTSSLPLPAKVQLDAKALRDLLILEASTSIITVFTVDDGSILFQNHRSRSYFGDRAQASTAVAGVAAAVAAAAAVSSPVATNTSDDDHSGECRRRERLAGADDADVDDDVDDDDAAAAAALAGSALAQLFALEPQKLVLLLETLATAPHERSGRVWKGVLRVPPCLAALELAPGVSTSTGAEAPVARAILGTGARLIPFDQDSQRQWAPQHSSVDPVSPFTGALCPEQPASAVAADTGNGFRPSGVERAGRAAEPAPRRPLSPLRPSPPALDRGPVPQQQRGDAHSFSNQQHPPRPQPPQLQHHQHHQHHHYWYHSSPLGSSRLSVTHHHTLATLAESARICDPEVMFDSVTATGISASAAGGGAAAAGAAATLSNAPYAPRRPQSATLSTTALASSQYGAVQGRPHSGILSWRALKLHIGCGSSTSSAEAPAAAAGGGGGGDGGAAADAAALCSQRSPFQSIDAGGGTLLSTSTYRSAIGGDGGSGTPLDAATASAAEHLEEAMTAGSGPLATSVLTVTLSENPSLATTLSLRYRPPLFGGSQPQMSYPRSAGGSAGGAGGLSSVINLGVDGAAGAAAGGATATAVVSAPSTMDPSGLRELMRPQRAAGGAHAACTGLMPPSWPSVLLPPASPPPPPPLQQHEQQCTLSANADESFAQPLPRVPLPAGRPPRGLCRGSGSWPRCPAGSGVGSGGGASLWGSERAAEGGLGPGRVGSGAARLGSGPAGLGSGASGIGSVLCGSAASRAGDICRMSGHLTPALPQYVPSHPNAPSPTHTLPAPPPRRSSLAGCSSGGALREYRGDGDGGRALPGSGRVSIGDGRTTTCSLIDGRTLGGDVTSSWALTAVASSCASTAHLSTLVVPYGCHSTCTGDVMGPACVAAASLCDPAALMAMAVPGVPAAPAPAPLAFAASVESPLSRPLRTLPISDSLTAGQGQGQIGGGASAPCTMQGSPTVLPQPPSPAASAASGATTAPSVVKLHEPDVKHGVQHEAEAGDEASALPWSESQERVRADVASATSAGVEARAGVVGSPSKSGGSSAAYDSELAGWRKGRILQIIPTDATTAAAMAAAADVREIRNKNPELDLAPAWCYDSIGGCDTAAICVRKRPPLNGGGGGDARASDPPAADVITAAAAARPPAESAAALHQSPGGHGGGDEALRQAAPNTDCADTDWGVMATFRQSALACGARSPGRRSGSGRSNDPEERDSPDTVCLQAALDVVAVAATAVSSVATATAGAKAADDAAAATAIATPAAATGARAGLGPGTTAAVAVAVAAEVEAAPPPLAKEPDVPSQMHPQQQQQHQHHQHHQQRQGRQQEQEKQTLSAWLEGRGTEQPPRTPRDGRLAAHPPVMSPAPPPRPPPPPPQARMPYMLPSGPTAIGYAPSRPSESSLDKSQSLLLPPPPSIQGCCWHRVIAAPAMDPVTGRDVIVVTQDDVTGKVQLERRLGLMLETEHRLLEQLYPPHMLRRLADELLQHQRREREQQSLLLQQRQQQQLQQQGLCIRQSTPGLGGGGAWLTAAPCSSIAGVAGAAPGMHLTGSRGASLDCASARLPPRYSSSAGTGSKPGSCALPPPLRPSPPLRGGSCPMAMMHPQVTLLFADIKGFTPMCKELQPREVMVMLNDLFSRFDALLDKYGVRKVETIGDAYFVAGGLTFNEVDREGAGREGDGSAAIDVPLTGARAGAEAEAGARAGAGSGAGAAEGEASASTHALKIIEYAKAMLVAAQRVPAPHKSEPVQVRVGVHSGPIVSGLIGSRMPRFCLFGNAVAAAARMESTGEAGAVHISEATFSLLPREDRVAWEATPGVEVKGYGRMQTYLWRGPAGAVGGKGRVEVARKP